MLVQIWSDKKVLARALGVELASVGFWLEENTAQSNAEKSFQLTMDARVLGVQIGSKKIDPLQNGVFTIPLIAEVGGQIDGRIDSWRGLDHSGATISGAGWPNLASVGFTVTALAKPNVAFATVGISGGILGAALRAFGHPTVTIDIGHIDVVTHVYGH